MVGIMLFGTLGLVVALGVLRGWVLSYLWLWFLVPVGVPAIGVAHAMGMSLLISLFTSHAASRDAEMKEGWDAFRYLTTKLLGYAATALTFLGFGYILAAVMT